MFHAARMAKLDPKVLLLQATDYLKHHPEEIVRLVRGALGFRFGVPMATVRFLAQELEASSSGPKDLVVEAAPPGLRVAGTVKAMGTPLRVSGLVFVEELHVSGEQLKVGLRIENMGLQVVGESDTPVAALVKSGALDLSRPANLVATLPKRPAVIVDAKDDRLMLDLLQVPAIANNAKLRQAIAVMTPVLGLRAIRTRDDHLDLHFKGRLSGLPEAARIARSAR